MDEGFEAKRLANIQRNRALLDELGIKQHARAISSSTVQQPPNKKRKVEKLARPAPTRVSARIATAPAKPSYREDDKATLIRERGSTSSKTKNARRPTSSTVVVKDETPEKEAIVPPSNIEDLQASWSSWKPATSDFARDEMGTFHFGSHPDFTPNRSPEEMLREGCFGGSYYRPLYTRTLGITVTDDWKELPASWTEGLNVSKYLTSSEYDPDVNKFKVACGQSIEEWEAAGWINHNYDVRGWFQWYCRFFMGRRCDDDERQVSRWKKCVGKTGRWRRMLLKKYVSAGVRDCFDDGEDGEDTQEVSPVMHQTCHHWAFCVTQDVLDEYWKTGL